MGIVVPGLPLCTTFGNMQACSLQCAQVHAAPPQLSALGVCVRAKNTFLEEVYVDTSGDHGCCSLRRCLSDSVLFDVSAAHVLEAYAAEIENEGGDSAIDDENSTVVPDDEDSDQFIDDEAAGCC